MTPERWQQILEILEQAIDLDLSQRREFLEQVCGNDQNLRREVEELLSSSEQTNDFLENRDVIAEAIAKDKSQTQSGNMNDDTTTKVSKSDEQSYLGTVLNGRYKIERQLDEGGFGTVFLALDQHFEIPRRVAIKILQESKIKNFSNADWIKKKFAQEVEAMLRIDDKAVVDAFDKGKTHDGNPFLVMKYIDGPKLSSLIEQGGTDFATVANIINELGRALDVVHREGITHCDLKPGNIMLHKQSKSDMQVKIIDFGIAKVEDSQVSEKSVTTMQAGSVPYMSPEQLEGKKPTASSDIFALAVIAYEMLTGERPFKQGSQFEMLKAQKKGIQFKSIDLKPEIPKAAQSEILKALSYDPKKRHESAGEFGKRLAKALEPGLAPDRRPIISIDLKRPRLEKKRSLSTKPWPVFLGIALLLGLSTLLFFSPDPPKPESVAITMPTPTLSHTPTPTPTLTITPTPSPTKRPPPSPPPYLGPLSGFFNDSVTLKKGETKILEGKFPGVPIDLVVKPEGYVSFEEPPMPSNKWKKAIIRANRNVNHNLTFTWTVKIPK